MDKNDEPIKVDEVEESQDMNPKQVLNILFKKAKQISKSSTCSQKQALLHHRRPRRNGTSETKHVKGNQPNSLEA